MPTSSMSTRVSSHNPSAIERIQQPSATLETLPPELVEIILQHVVSRPNNRLIYPPQGDLHVHCHQWPLRHVCRAWRAFALAEPNFWNNIHIFLDRIGIDERPFLDHESRLEFWSHHIVDSLCPLTVTIIGDETEYMDSQVTVIQDMILRPNSCRIFELTSKPCNVLVTFDKPELVFPVLERFHCVVPRLLNLQILKMMPSLHELNITPIPDRWFNRQMIGDIPHGQIPWAQLTDLSVSDGTRESQWNSLDLMIALNILSLCTELKRCTFHIAPETQEITLLHNIYHPHLESLCIFQTFDEQATTANVFLNYIIAPSLVNLEYSSAGAYCIGPTEVLSFFHRSNCSLKTLYLDSDVWRDNANPDPDTVQLLQMVPSVTVLYAPILHVSESHSVVEEIVTGALLPNVEAVGLFSATINLPALVGLLQQNGLWRPPHDSVAHPKLRDVFIYSKSDVPSSDQKTTGRPRFTLTSRGSLYERNRHFKSQIY